MGERSHDDELLDALAAALDAAEPTPPGVAELGRDAWDARALDAELAELIGDSLVDAGDAVALRADAGPRLLSFASGPTSIELEVSPGPSGALRIDGVLVPVAAAHVTLEAAEAGRSADAGPDGRFAFAGVAPGVVRLRVEPVAGPPVVSTWFRL
jgi:hypothetical protein